jgi:hypothetical protein
MNLSSSYIILWDEMEVYVQWNEYISLLDILGTTEVNVRLIWVCGFAFGFVFSCGMLWRGCTGGWVGLVVHKVNVHREDALVIALRYYTRDEHIDCLLPACL